MTDPNTPGIVHYTGRCTYCGKVLELFERDNPHGGKIRQPQEFECPNQIGPGHGTCTVDSWHQVEVSSIPVHPIPQIFVPKGEK